ncbi:hypothetical protein DKP78_25865, partial [Enterococcus faecium]
LPREFPKDEDQSLVKRNKRMLGKLLVGTLEKFQQEDKKTVQHRGLYAQIRGSAKG